MVLQDLNSEHSWIVSAACAGLRLDAFLRAQLPFLSRSEVQGALQKCYFWINGRRARKGERLADGDRVRFRGPAAWLSPGPAPNPSMAVPIVHEDMHLLALNKPAGMHCHGFSGLDDAALANFLLARWPGLSAIGDSRWEPGLVHRLDYETSGLILVAKTQSAFDDLCRQFRRHAIQKKYLALVWGSTGPRGAIDFPLVHDPRDERKMQVAFASDRRARKPKVWPALTRFRKLCERRGLSLLELEMQTGVTHQLRAHLAAINHPILGDRLYGAGKRESLGLRRHFLHAAELHFVHPGSKKPLTLKAPLTPELSAVLKRLKIHSVDDRSEAT
jgi:23S rRNA pseudouridine1911/1915/1917 synthase